MLDYQHRFLIHLDSTVLVTPFLMSRGKKENIKNPSSSLLGENHASQKNILSHLLFSTQLVWVFFPVFLVFFLPFSDSLRSHTSLGVHPHVCDLFLLFS